MENKLLIIVAILVVFIIWIMIHRAQKNRRRDSDNQS